jgi:hypothetical protein
VKERKEIISWKTTNKERERGGMYLHGLASMFVVYHLGLE